MGLIKEFKEFALKGNVMDMAIGVIIGGAFGGIVKSMIDDMIMPIIGLAKGADFSNFYLPLNGKAQAGIASAVEKTGTLPSLADAKTYGPILAYGSFITVVLQFLIMAVCVFMIVKAMNTARKHFEKEQAAAPPAEQPPDVKLLTEIRDILKTK